MNTNLATIDTVNNTTTTTNNNNIVGINPDTPYNRIISFINEYESENTRVAYLKHYKEMFQYMCGKTLEQLTYQDINDINDIKVEGYRNYLKSIGRKANTINSKIASCKALFDRFKERRIIQINDFDIKPLLETENSYGSLTNKEVEDLYDYCLNLPVKRKNLNLTLKLYFEFLYTVTCRKSATQNLTWSKINKELDIETGKMIYVCTFMDKGKEVKKAIQDDFYNQLMDNYKNNNEDSGKVFNVHNNTIDKVLKDFCKEYGIDKKRNICQHSIKGSGLDRIMSITGDINTVALAGQHKTINMPYKKYLNKNRRFSEHPSYFLNKDFSIDMLKDLTKEELLQLIQNSGKETVIRLCLELEGKKH